MERFVQAIVVGGVALVAGLWIGTLSRVGAPEWIVGAALVVLGGVALAWGIGSEIAVGP